LFIRVVNVENVFDILLQDSHPVRHGQRYT
jgi:hypothetical protein